MKRIYLKYNNLSNRYIFVEGSSFHSGRRETWMVKNINGLLKKLKESVDLKRKSVLRLESIPKDAEKSISNFFNNTKVEIKIISYTQ